MIVVYGATGFTGRLVAAELVRLGEPCAVAGRNGPALEVLAARLRAGGAGAIQVEVRVAAVDDAEALVAAFSGADAVISCAGPFELVGDPVVDAAVEAGVPFCDSTGEPGYMARVMGRHTHAGVPVVPACGFDYVPHTLAATLAADRLGGEGDPDRVETALLVRHLATSAGTKRSMLASLGGAGTEYEGGAPVASTVAARQREFTFPPPDGRSTGISYPGGDVEQLHAQFPKASVRAHLVTTGPVARVAPVAVSVLQPVLANRRVAELMERVVGWGPEGPSEVARARNRWAIVAEVTRGDRTERAVATGRDVYGLTAVLLTRVAVRLADPKLRADMPAGACAPAQVVGDPAGFAAHCGFTLQSG